MSVHHARHVTQRMKYKLDTLRFPKPGPNTRYQGCILLMQSLHPILVVLGRCRRFKASKQQNPQYTNSMSCNHATELIVPRHNIHDLAASASHVLQSRVPHSKDISTVEGGCLRLQVRYSLSALRNLFKRSASQIASAKEVLCISFW